MSVETLLAFPVKGSGAVHCSRAIRVCASMSLALKTVFSLGALGHLAGGRSLERGAEYVAMGRVKKLKVDDAEASAAACGTREYRVRLWLEDGGQGIAARRCPDS